MASDAAAPNVSNAIRSKEGCIAPGGFAAARARIFIRNSRFLVGFSVFVSASYFAAGAELLKSTSDVATR
jgi:hypothetical protein